MLLGTLTNVSSVSGVNWASEKLETEDICLKKKKGNGKYLVFFQKLGQLGFISV